MKRVVRQF